MNSTIAQIAIARKRSAAARDRRLRARRLAAENSTAKTSKSMKQPFIAEQIAVKQTGEKWQVSWRPTSPPDRHGIRMCDGWEKTKTFTDWSKASKFVSKMLADNAKVIQDSKSA